MYKDFKVKNFRGFKEFHIGSLNRVSLIMGKNNVGKTALLEILCLHAGRNNPDLPAQLEAMRGRPKRALNPIAIWGWLFHNKEINEAIETVAVNEEGITSSAKFTLAQTTTAVSVAPNVEPGIVPSDVSPGMSVLPRNLLIEYPDVDGETKTSRAFVDVNEKKIKLEFADVKCPVPLVYISCRSVFGDADVERFSEVDSEGGIDEIVDVLKYMEPRLSRLSLAYEGNLPVLKADIDIGELIPIHDVGQGFCRCLQLMLAICVAKNGIVFVDEIENGIHHSVMFGIWRAIAHLANESKHNVQVIATTHGRECVKAAYDAFEGIAPEGLGAYRLERTQEDAMKVVTYDTETLEQSLASGWELR